MGFKRKVYTLLEVSDKPNSASYNFDVFIISLIVLNVLAIVLESVASLAQQFSTGFQIFELFSVFVFTIEYVLRVWTANLNPKYSTPIAGNVRYAFTPLAIIDLLAILPFFLPLLGVDLRLLRILRIFRIFRLFKITRYVDALADIRMVFKQKKEELVISLMLTLFLLLIASTLMFYVENESQPDKFSSIPETMWWGIATLTTVGYGDIYPVTPMGQLLAGVIAIIGIAFLALPTGILASGFSEAFRKEKSSDHCPACGQSIPSKEAIS
ncbi:ion transporter [Arenibacter sp. GZD96]|uniref:ion transporter n=1 Tax=Aurantibrevibacter litoralis TaxID=3106030 RepID=UPI002AFF543C|nr:ion transporter [Arenibacter sp. GZD-96]MEA1784958.1 ion transporter [Arenibacter sp. GZD-96]